MTLICFFSCLQTLCKGYTRFLTSFKTVTIQVDWDFTLNLCRVQTSVRSLRLCRESKFCCRVLFSLAFISDNCNGEKYTSLVLLYVGVQNMTFDYKNFVQINLIKNIYFKWNEIFQSNVKNFILNKVIFIYYWTKLFMKVFEKCCLNNNFCNEFQTWYDPSSVISIHSFSLN